MKYLTLIRHAKSSRDNPRQPDEARPLDSRGERDAPAMSRHELHDDGQAESRPTRVAGPGVVEAHEALEDTFPLLWNDARPVVVDL